MKDIIFNPNCSEAVFRFHTVDPEKIHYILQAIADEIAANNPAIGKQKIKPQRNTKLHMVESQAMHGIFSGMKMIKDLGKRKSKKQKRDPIQKVPYYMHVQVWEIMRQ